jgi:phosphoheptose isomerase
MTMRNSSKILRSGIVGANQTLQSLRDLDAQVAKAADLIEESLRTGNKLLVCGNGGSAADASHFATEFVVRVTKAVGINRLAVALKQSLRKDTRSIISNSRVAQW